MNESISYIGAENLGVRMLEVFVKIMPVGIMIVFKKISFVNDVTIGLSYGLP
jgi:predicted metallo-beta-lactamase superfamily hydrolase